MAPAPAAGEPVPTVPLAAEEADAHEDQDADDDEGQRTEHDAQDRAPSQTLVCEEKVIHGAGVQCIFAQFNKGPALCLVHTTTQSDRAGSWGLC